MSFETAHQLFVDRHLHARTGERRGRLQRGHREAEQLFCSRIWWPVVGHFEHLHPEYEVMDWRGISYFCDFAWLPPYAKLIFEIKGFGPHVRDMDRIKYCNELNRETFLASLGYQVISFAYDDVSQRPELCRTLLKMLLGRFLAESVPIPLNGLAEREVTRLAYLLARPLRPVDVTKHLGVSYRTAVDILRSLCSKGWFNPLPSVSGKYITRYAVKEGRLPLL